jgi:4-diphosphocytidyl-2-C-methyl-D-erythritol kinase
MVCFPNAKINLGLRVTRKREDGYHDLESIFLPVGIYDALEILPALDNSPTSITQSGIIVPGEPTHHLCMKAWALMRSVHPDLPSIRIHLHKTIPMGAGMGGGSSDGAFTLSLLNDLFKLGHTKEDLARFALQLGSDCPFFVYNEPCIARGRGEQLTPVNFELVNFELLVVHPGIHISTKQAFTGITPSEEGPSLETLIQGPVSTWRDTVRNDFEHTVFTAEPAIGRIKNLLYEKGAVYASMTGSGSAVYGLFPKSTLPSIVPEPGWKVFRPAILG